MYTWSPIIYQWLSVYASRYVYCDPDQFREANGSEEVAQKLLTIYLNWYEDLPSFKKKFKF